MTIRRRDRSCGRLRFLRENVETDELCSPRDDYLSGYPDRMVRWGLSRRIRLQREGLQGQIDVAEEALRLDLGRRTGRWYEAIPLCLNPFPPPRD